MNDMLLSKQLSYSPLAPFLALSHTLSPLVQYESQPAQRKKHSIFAKLNLKLQHVAIMFGHFPEPFRLQ